MNTLIYNMETDIDKLASDVVQLLSDRGLSISTAESCTGGLLSGAITGVNGASSVFNLGLCTYANIAKTEKLGVSEETLRLYGAVSSETAAEMAIGAVKAAKSDIGISTTGIAGPTGGSAEKPVGTVHFACCYGEKIKKLQLRINADKIPSNDEKRKYIRLESVRQALILVKDIVE